MLLIVLVVISIILNIVNIVYTHNLIWYYEKIFDAMGDIIKDSQKSN